MLYKLVITDKIPIKSLLEKFKLKSVNQMAASIMLVETWKIMNGLSPYKCPRYLIGIKGMLDLIIVS